MGNKSSKLFHKLHLRSHHHRGEGLGSRDSNATAEESQLDLFLKKNMTDNDLQLLLPRTHFTPVEFKLLKQYFYSLFDTLFLNQHQCRDLFFGEKLKDEKFVFTDQDDFVLTAIFNAVNTDHDGVVSFAEFVQSLSIACHGRFEEKAEFSFRLYDANGNGCISKQEMINYMKTLHQLGILRISSKLRQTRGEYEDREMKRLEAQRNSEFKEDLPNTAIGLNLVEIQYETTSEKYPQTIARQEIQSAQLPNTGRMGTLNNFSSLSEYANRNQVMNTNVSESYNNTTHAESDLNCVVDQITAVNNDKISNDDHSEVIHLDGMEETATTANGAHSASSSMDGESMEDNSAESKYGIDPGIIPTESEIETLLHEFFGDKDELSFEDYLERSGKERYLVEGLGIYEYIFYPVYKPIQDFLATSAPSEKSGLLVHDERSYFCEIAAGSLSLYTTASKITRVKNVNMADIIRVTQPRKNTFVLYVKRKKRLEFETVPNSESAQNWFFCVMLYLISSKDNRYSSFSPVRENVLAYPLVDGDETFSAIANAIIAAKEQILIAGWCVSPQIYLKRDRSIKDLSRYRLDNLLLSAAKRNVKIYIILWHETTLAGMNLNTLLTHKYFSELHPNIKSLLHPPSTPYIWTHHQKVVVVDQIVGFCGGIDLAWGRYDNREHTITDNCHLSLTWPGNDYYNLAVNRCVSCKTKLDSFRDGIDRDRFPRMPWHDVHCVVSGKLAYDLASNIISRWNHHGGVGTIGPVTLASEKSHFLGDVANIFSTGSDRNIQAYLPANISLQQVRGQVIRSMSTWSGSLQTEESIHAAYVNIIKEAMYYIYIENQYFCSKTNLCKKIRNLIAQAIIERIGRAIERKEVFRVYIVMPMHPDGDPLDSAIQQIIKYERRTILGVFQTLKSKYPEAEIEKYITFFSLCNYGYLQGIQHFSQVYVHSKLMIVDDRITVIGSANINDRSMNGDKDSEIAVIIEDTDSTQTLMNNKLRRVGKFGKNLRKRLWREHLGINATQHLGPTTATKEELLSPASATATIGNLFRSRDSIDHKLLHKFQHQKQNLMNQPLSIAMKDPISDFTYNSICKRAKENSRIYESVFAHFPSAKHATVSDYKKDLEEYRRMVDAFIYTRSERNRETESQLSNIKGFIIEYPVNWFYNDPFKKAYTLSMLDSSMFY